MSDGPPIPEQASLTSVGIDGRKFRASFVLLLVLAISCLFLAVTWPFLKALLLGAMFAGLANPLYKRLVVFFRGRRSLASAMTLLLLFLLGVGPLSAVLGVVVKQAVEISQTAIPWVQQKFGAAGGMDLEKWLIAQFPMLKDVIPSQQEMLNTLGAAAQSAGGFLVASASKMTAGTAAFFLDFFVMVYAMFFFLRDGPAILERIFYYTPLSNEDEERMLERFVSVTRATIKGTLVIGLIQGTLAGVAFWFAGVGGAAFWGTLMIILSIIPGVGSAIVWVPAVIYLFATGQTLNGILLGTWCAAVVGTIDNVLRPMLVGKDAKMPDLLILVGTLGGLFLFGPIGFIVGPIICGLFLTVWEIYGVAFRDLLPPVKRLRSPIVKTVPAALPAHVRRERKGPRRKR